MTKPLLNAFRQPTDYTDDLWQQLKLLRPRLRQHVHVLPREFRGVRWFLLQDETSGRYLRCDALAQAIIRQLNGELSLQEILERNNRTPAFRELRSDDIIAVFSRLHASELLTNTLPISTALALERYSHLESQARRKRWSNPFAIKFPLLDPDRHLSRLIPIGQLIFSRIGLIFWLALLALGSINALNNREELKADIGAWQFSTSDALVLWLAYPLLKALHEFGHALAIKVFGGEVHETGISLLVLVPVPYVDASASLGFRSKYRRIVVSAAGIMIETALAAVAVSLWTVVENGIIRDTLLALAILGSMSTILYNANPLMRFDGYHVLEDLIEIPDLARRSVSYWKYLFQHYALTLDAIKSPVTARGERRWFLIYGLSSPLYRLTVLLGIAYYLSSQFFIVGVILASWVVWNYLIKQLLNAICFLLASKEVDRQRPRAQLLLAIMATTIAALLLLRVPLITRTEGIVWPANGGQLISPSNAFIVEVFTVNGESVFAGQPVMQLKSPALQTRFDVINAKLKEARLQQSIDVERSRARGAIAEEQVDVLEAERDDLASRLTALTLLSPVNGVFTQHNPHYLPGRFAHDGELLGYVRSRNDTPVVRAVVAQRDAGHLNKDLLGAEVMLSSRSASAISASLIRDYPSGTRQLPSRALDQSGGGSLTVQHNDGEGLISTEEFFQLDLKLDLHNDWSRLGERVYVRLNHGSQALWRIIWTRLQQLFLRTAL